MRDVIGGNGDVIATIPLPKVEWVDNSDSLTLLTPIIVQQMAKASRPLDTPTLLAIDLAILDYLTHVATSTLLQNHSSTATTRSLEMFDGVYLLLGELLH